MAYNEDTNSRLVDAKLILDKILDYDGRHDDVLSTLNIDEFAIRMLRDDIEWLINMNDISYNCQTSIVADCNIKNNDEIYDAFDSARERIDGIDDPCLWTEEEYMMGDIMAVLNTVCGVNL